MRLSVIIGAVLILFGLALAIPTAIGREDQQAAISASERPYDRQTEVPSPESRQTLVIIAAGVLIAGGAALVGVGMGNWRQPNRDRQKPATDPEIG